MTVSRAINAAAPEVRDAALALLDEVSAPLTERQIQKAMEKAGYSRLRSRRMARALTPLHIIALLPR